MNYLFIDTETGGLDTNTSLLQAYFLLTDDKFEQVAELDLKIRPNDGIYKVTSQAINVNQIDLIEHNKESITESYAKDLLNDFFARTFKGVKFMPVGWNVGFDLAFIHEHLMDKKTWEQANWYGTIDVHSIYRYLKLNGKLPSECEDGLGKVADFLQVEHGSLHSAKADTILTKDLFKKLLTL